MNNKPLNPNTCTACKTSPPPLTKIETKKLLTQISNWDLSSETNSIKRVLKLKNFNQAIEVINQIATLAETENHHPDILLHNYDELIITLKSHKINGLSLNDFILAAKIDQLDILLSN